MSIVAISVDRPHHSERMIKRLGLTFPLASDSDQRIIKAFNIQNADTKELAQHAVYILDDKGRVFYRKVARRRPVSAELIDAIDASRGEYPKKDQRKTRPARRVAYPSNNFQTLIEMASVDKLPSGIDQDRFRQVLQTAQAGASSDDLLIAFRAFVEGSSEVSEDQLLSTANWLARQRFIATMPAALTAGTELHRRIERVTELERAHTQALDAASKDKLLHTLAAARGGLAKARATVSNNAGQWNLRYAQGALRGYREVVHAR